MAVEDGNENANEDDEDDNGEDVMNLMEILPSLLARRVKRLK